MTGTAGALALAALPVRVPSPAVAAPVARVRRATNARVVVDGKPSRPLQVGNPVSLNDRIVTGSTGMVDMRFADGTEFFIGPNADLAIDRFISDPGRGEAEFSVSVVIGAFRFLSGQVADVMAADIMADAFRVTTPVATIGIRGTHVLASVEPDQTGCIVLLPDPRPGAQDSAMTVTAAGRGVTIAQVNRGTDVKDATDGPTGPRAWPRDRVPAMPSLAGGSGRRR